MSPFSEPHSGSSFVMLLTGPGWGKSTAAFGYAARAAGRGHQVTIVQFLKGGAWNRPEASLLTGEGISWPVLTNALTWHEDPKGFAAAAWGEAQQGLARPGLLILDELTRAVDHDLLQAAEIAGSIRSRHPESSVIITGKNSMPELEEVADIITRFDLLKHNERIGKPLAP
ncbi:cob(I)yrinic acid a,c-diamide adenosyltransferase [Nesterenkonia alkaliphila]|uniref:Cob(I)yrinic acid a,c-diamide adenosyltransferase n=1 Tax=Nesterenkonia alkaliphila TaxID=1463631 RepID=A0A7K1UKJ4_9MICC|nr:cob(I)yrinic acid a,c-diamide adenosyltransferase [Nesterenkonia alkaliphila]MVT26990.1 cob(I)yrinic acid a,c-diamide adenosyltransferase [Nesterenkonia alkaliphila]GFZ88191.1 cob(I)alamin adenosyltransferase [Nesterenkonia alkaliphila]